MKAFDLPVSLRTCAPLISLLGAVLATACSSKSEATSDGGVGPSSGGAGGVDNSGTDSAASGGSTATGGNAAGGNSAAGGTGGRPGSGGNSASGGNFAAGNGGSVSTATGGSVVDGSSPDRTSPADASTGTVTQDGALASCIRGVFGTYVLRADGIALFEPSANNEHVIVETTTALPLTGITAVQGGASHGCAVLDNGSVACWQTVASNGNTAGQLGNGTITPSAVIYRSTPVLSAANTPVVNAITFATGGESTNPLNSTCVVSSDAKLWCWGDLTWIVNNGTTLHSPYAQAITIDGIAPLANVLQATYTTTGACALVQGSPNTVWCWGINGSNELAQGDTINRQYPTKVLGLSAPTKVIISNSFGTANTVCVLDGDNVRCWGNNQNASVGVNSTTSPIASPTLVVTQNGTTALSGVVEIAPGTAAFSVLRVDGTLWNWGNSFNRYAGNYGLTNVLAIGYAGGFGGNGPRFLTSDGVYHNGMNSIAVNCGVLQ
jgi:alpha-tubulin suppressor-like RCC1 family protein